MLFTVRLHCFFPTSFSNLKVPTWYFLGICIIRHSCPCCICHTGQRCAPRNVGMGQMWGEWGRQREGKDRKVHLSAYCMPGTLQDTLCIIQKLANLLFSPTQGFPFSRGSVTTNGIMQESPGQLIPGILKLWREDTLCPQKWFI